MLGGEGCARRGQASACEIGERHDPDGHGAGGLGEHDAPAERFTFQFPRRHTRNLHTGELRRLASCYRSLPMEFSRLPVLAVEALLVDNNDCAPRFLAVESRVVCPCHNVYAFDEGNLTTQSWV